MYLFFTQHRARAYSQFDSGNVFSQVWRPKSSLYILVWLKHSILSSLTGLFLMSSLTETQYSLNHCIFSKTIKFDLNAVSPLTNLHSSIFLSSWSYCSFSAFLSELMLYFIIEYFRSARILFRNCTWLNKTTQKVVKNFHFHFQVWKLKGNFCKNKDRIWKGAGYADWSKQSMPGSEVPLAMFSSPTPLRNLSYFVSRTNNWRIEH